MLRIKSHITVSFQYLPALFGIAFTGLLIGFLVARIPEEKIGFAFVFSFLFLPAAIFALNSKPLTRFYAMVFFLPFLQALSVKFGPRWSLSELLAWSITLPALAGIQKNVVSNDGRDVLKLLLITFLYSICISSLALVLILPQFPWNPAALYFFKSPLARTIVENARLLAAFGAIVALLKYVRSENSFLKTMRLFGLSGIAASTYGLYQGVQMLWMPSLPLLPGTLSQSGLRLWGSFYEPNGFGGFCLITFIVLGFLAAYDRRCRWLWLIGLVTTMAGVVFSVATTAWIAGMVAGGILMISSLHKIRYTPRALFIILSTVIILLLILHFAGQLLDLAEMFWRNRSLANLEHRFEDIVVERFGATIRWLTVSPVGIGQGLMVFLYAGAGGILRWITEMGIIGTLLILSLQWKIWKAILLLFRKRGLFGAFAPFAVALYVGTLIVASRYGHPTDVWIWFVLCLPLVVFNKDLSFRYHRIS